MLRWSQQDEPVWRGASARSGELAAGEEEGWRGKSPRRGRKSTLTLQVVLNVAVLLSQSQSGRRW